MKIMSWNVNGIRAVHNKGLFLPFVSKYKPDILCLQETKAFQHQYIRVPAAPPEGGASLGGITKNIGIRPHGRGTAAQRFFAKKSLWR